MKKVTIGHRLFGAAAVVFGLTGFYWRNFNTWQQINALGNVAHREVLACIVAILEILGGIAIQWEKAASAGAITLGLIYLAFASLWVPFIVATPLVYDRWGNFFEQFSLVSGALIVFALSEKSNPKLMRKIARVGYICFGICVISFTLEQLFYLHGTASLVPKWIPPGQMFWSVATTAAFGLAAIALLSGRCAITASRLLTTMIVVFGLLIWIPAPFAHPHEMISWAANAENFAIAGSAWIVVDYLNLKVSPTPAEFREVPWQ